MFDLYLWSINDSHLLIIFAQNILQVFMDYILYVCIYHIRVPQTN